MAEPSTIARPYAEAIYRLAETSGKLSQWSEMLADLSKVAADARIRAAMNDPNLSGPKVAGMFLAVLAGRLTGDAENLVRVLADNRRLELLGEIAAQFEALKNEHEGTVEAEIVSQERGDKLIVFKFRRRKRFRKKAGHRQYYTQVKITGVKA